MQSNLYLYKVKCRNWDNEKIIEEHYGIITAESLGAASNRAARLYPNDIVSVGITLLNSDRIHLTIDSYYELLREIELEKEYRI